MPARRKTTAFALGAAALLMLPAAVRAQTPEGDLHAQIAEMDRVVFAAARACDEATLNRVFREDVEFYHDLAGVTQPRERIVADIMRFCEDDGVGLRRALVEDSLEVHPIAGFGAIQIADHVFFELVDGEEQQVGSGRLVHIWENAGGEWRLARVLSFDHAASETP